jgi:hypothetical protein
MTNSERRRRRALVVSRVRASVAGNAVVMLLALLLSASRLGAQVRERPVPFDSAGRVMSITPPLAARLALAPPVWPVAGDYLDVRLYALDDSAGSAVLVVRRQREVLERYALTPVQRGELTRAVDRGTSLVPDGRTESVASTVSEPVKGAYVLNQSLLGGLLFGPAAAALTGSAAGGTAAYLLVTGGTFFLAADRIKSQSVSRAQNHLSWHLARQGAGAGYLAAYLAGGESMDEKAYAAAMLVGGIAGNVLGDRLARPLTDAEAHGLSHGPVFVASLAAGALGTFGLSDTEASRRGAAAVVLGAQAVGYPIGLRYARGSRYRVSSGDVGTLVVGEAIGLATAAAFVARDDAQEQAVSGALTAGFALGAVVADRALVKPFDYTDAESRLLQLGAVAGAVVGIAIPVLAESDHPAPYFGAMSAGGLFGVFLTHNLLEPARASSPRATPARTGALPRPSRVAVRFTPQNLIPASRRIRGVYPLLDVRF